MPYTASSRSNQFPSALCEGAVRFVGRLTLDAPLFDHHGITLSRVSTGRRPSAQRFTLRLWFAQRCRIRFPAGVQAAYQGHLNLQEPGSAFLTRVKTTETIAFSNIAVSGLCSSPRSCFRTAASRISPASTRKSCRISFSPSKRMFVPHCFRKTRTGDKTGFIHVQRSDQTTSSFALSSAIICGTHHPTGSAEWLLIGPSNLGSALAHMGFTGFTVPTLGPSPFTPGFLTTGFLVPHLFTATHKGGDYIFSWQFNPFGGTLSPIGGSLFLNPFLGE